MKISIRPAPHSKSCAWGKNASWCSKFDNQPLRCETECPEGWCCEMKHCWQVGEALRLNLRRGDTISRCSVSQYILMLPKANYEDSCMVCRRVITAFHKTHPHIAVRINFMVQPLTPNICVP